MKCDLCVMDDTAEEFKPTIVGALTSENITLETTRINGCNFCNRARQSLRDTEIERHNLSTMLGQIKKDGEGKEYDCLIGLSGGLDSSTTVDWAIKNGLRVLAFTLDNSYNTKEANHNINRLVTKLDLEHKVIRVDAEKYTKLQNAFFIAGVKNCEIPTDHILMAVSLKLAKENDIKWILSGGNSVSESIMPESWGYNARDLTHIKDIFSRVYPDETLDDLPTCSIWEWNHYKHDCGIQTFYPLDYLDYNLKESKEYLAEEYDWQDYGLKHEESIFTGWFQNVFLPLHWGIDKRRAHLSSLIVAGQMTRDEALAILAKPPKSFKFPIFSLNEGRVMNYEKHEHNNYKMEKWYEIIAEEMKDKQEYEEYRKKNK